MAIQGISYRYCQTGRTRYLGLDDGDGSIVGHPSAGPDIGGNPAQDDDLDFDASCELADELLYSDANYEVYSKGSYPFAKVVSVSSPPPPPPPPPIVCNLSLAVTAIALASAPGVADGAITISGYDPNTSAAERFNIGSDFTYPSGGFAGTLSSGITTKTFSGLLPGTYTVYVRNSTNCLATIQVEIGVEDPYGPLYRLEWNDFENNGSPAQYRFDIEEKDYAGAVTEVNGGVMPCVDSWRNEAGEDVFEPAIPGEVQVTLYSETDQQFIGLYTTSERKYRGTLYRYNGSSYEQKWQGFLVPMLYSEPYVLQKRYEVSLSFIDLGSLSEEDFTTIGGSPFKGRMSLMSAISTILQKTGLRLPIWESANIYSADMNSADYDSMLTQCYFDPEVYLDSDGEPQDCKTVLTSLLTNFVLRLYQAKGRWNVELVTQKLASSVLVRKFDYAGVYDSYESLSPRLPVRRANQHGNFVNFHSETAILNIPEQYGKVKVIYDLGTEEKNNMLLRGEFEEEDLENGQFFGWQVTPQIGSGATFGIEKLVEERDGSTTALYVDFDSTDLDKYVDVLSLPIGVAWPGEGYTLQLKFDVYTVPAFKEVDIFLDYALTLNDDQIILSEFEDTPLFSSYLQALGMIDTFYNRVFIKDHLAWKQISITVPVSTETIDSITTAGALQVKLRVRSNPEYDLASLTALKALPTARDFTSITPSGGFLTRNKYRSVKVLDTSGGVQVIRFYSFQDGIASTDEPNIVVADDGFAYWRLEKTVPRPGINNWLQSILITNVRVSYLPENAAPLEKITKEIVVNSEVKRTYEKTLLHGDITPDMDANYRYISRGHLTLGPLTLIQGGWTRKGEGENKLLHELVASMYQGQYAVQRWKLSGTLEPRGDADPDFFNTFQEYRTGRIYLPVSMAWNRKERSMEVEMIEALQGEAVVDEGDPVVPPVEPPVGTREHTTEFTTEFT